MAAAKEIRLDAAVSAVLLEVDGVFTLKAEQRIDLKAFLIGQHALNQANGSLGKSRIRKYTEALGALFRDLLVTKE